MLLRDEEFAANAGHTHGAFIGWRAFNAFVAGRLPLGDHVRNLPDRQHPVDNGIAPIVEVADDLTSQFAFAGIAALR